MNVWDENKTGYYLERTFNKQASILSANNKSKTAGRLIVMLYFERNPTLITVFIIVIKPLLPGCLPSPAHKGIHIITRCLTFILSTFIFFLFLCNLPVTVAWAIFLMSSHRTCQQMLCIAGDWWAHKHKFFSNMKKLSWLQIKKSNFNSPQIY